MISLPRPGPPLRTPTRTPAPAPPPPPPGAAPRSARIELDDLPAAPDAAVANTNGDRDVGTRLTVARRVDRDVRPGRVPQAVAERIERSSIVTVIGAVADEHSLVVSQDPVDGPDRGETVLGLRPCRRKPPAGLGEPEQHVGQRVAELLTREPREQHGGDLVGPGQQHGSARVHDYHRPGV